MSSKEMTLEDLGKTFSCGLPYVVHYETNHDGGSMQSWLSIHPDEASVIDKVF